MDNGYDEVDVTVSPSRHRWALVMLAHHGGLVLHGIVVDIGDLSLLEQNLRCDGVGDGVGYAWDCDGGCNAWRAHPNEGGLVLTESGFAIGEKEHAGPALAL